MRKLKRNKSRRINFDEALIKGCKENNYEEAVFFLSKHASPVAEKDGWNPLLWAANNGNEEIVRLLIKHNACALYLNQNQEDMQAAVNTKITTGAGG